VNFLGGAASGGKSLEGYELWQSGGVRRQRGSWIMEAIKNPPGFCFLIFLSLFYSFGLTFQSQIEVVALSSSPSCPELFY